MCVRILYFDFTVAYKAAAGVCRQLQEGEELKVGFVGLCSSWVAELRVGFVGMCFSFVDAAHQTRWTTMGGMQESK